MTSTPGTFFSKDYFAARELFLASARTAGARVLSEMHPTAKGPSGRDIFMDCAVLGPADATAALVVISGTHGPEGYCGSGVQIGLLQGGRAVAWAKSMRMILIHAHNAYGFAWDSRFNEDNIDLNRNYLASFVAPLPANPDYDSLAHWAAPAVRDDDTLNAARSGLMGFAMERGFPALQAALTGGQYNHPKGVYYGGLAPSWSHVTLVNFFKETCEGISKLVTIDMHTGLGPFGHGEILSEAAPDSAHFERQTAIWGDEVCSTKDGSSVSADLQGTMDSALTRVFSSIWSVNIAIEFGTIDTMSVFLATQASSWLHCYGDPEGSDAPAIMANSRAAFYPETDDWKAMVWARSLHVIGKAAAALEEDKSGSGGLSHSKVPPAKELKIESPSPRSSWGAGLG